MNLFGFDISLPNLPFIPGYWPGDDSRAVPDPKAHRELIDRVNDLIDSIAREYGVTAAVVLALPAGVDFENTTFRELLTRARLNTERLSEFERLLQRTQFERLLDRPYIPPASRPVDTRPTAKDVRGVGDYRPALPPKKLPGTTPTPSQPPSGGSGGGAGGGSTLGGMLQLPVVRTAARVASVASPLLDAYNLWRTYLDEPSDWVKQRDRDAARRGSGPSTRGGARTRTSSRTDAAVIESQRGRRVEQTHAQARRAAERAPRGGIWDTPPQLEQPDFTRSPGPRVATRRDVSRLPEPRIEGPGRITVRDPTRDVIAVEQPWWQTVGEVLYEFGQGYLRERAPRTRRRQPRQPEARDLISQLTGDAATGGPSPTRPEPSPSASPGTSTSPDQISSPSPPRCSSNDPCMRRAADKRREQRRRAKACGNKVKVTREVTICQRSK